MLPHVADFETEAIENRPNFPPKPVGLSLWKSGEEKPHYYAWGHPTGNNCTFEDAKRALADVWEQPILFHHGRFDVVVAEERMGFSPPPNPILVHDTLYLNFLYDPHAPSLGLKESAERILGIPPDEQSALKAYLASLGFTGKDWGAHISKAPGNVVEPYANGDTIRTGGIFVPLMDYVEKNGMLTAYQREQRLAPILNLNERDGIRIDLPRLQQDLVKYEQVFKDITELLLRMIGPCDPDKPAQFAETMMNTGWAKEEDFLRTPKGARSVSKESLEHAVRDPKLLQVVLYRNQLKTLLTTFMRPWERIASLCGGRVHPQFNQVRGIGDYGTRTGRLSSSNPNFQNVPTELKGVPPEGFPPLPFMRIYVLPDSDDEFIVSSDFNGQEMRITAHFAEGRAAQIYRDDPGADFHKVVAGILKEEAGLELPHKDVKITGFSLLYGSGIKSLAALLGVERSVAYRIREHYFDALPGFKELMNDVTRRGENGLPVKTWGGRLLYAEPAQTLANGQRWSFEYKLTNYLVQGSAADQTKEAINTNGYRTPYRRFLITVHDENVYTVKKSAMKDEVATIKYAMEKQPGWDVPFRAKTMYGANWHEMEVFT